MWDSIYQQETGPMSDLVLHKISLSVMWGCDWSLNSPCQQVLLVVNHVHAIQDTAAKVPQ